ncbi:50S ribosomal protein L11 methyltransferase [Thermosulfuriphilus sp.]
MDRRLWIEASITVPAEAEEAVSFFLTKLTGRGIIVEDIPPGAADQPWKKRLKAYLAEEDVNSSALARVFRFLAELEAVFPGVLDHPIETRPVFEEDWALRLKEHFRPRRIGQKIVVKPSWEVYVPRRGEIVVEIDPGMAFGTGAHPSTYLVLEALEELLEVFFKDPPYVLDVGTGTGILAIAAAKLGAKQVVGIDIDPEAAEVARNNVLKNEVHGLVTITTSPLFQLADLFDLILANIGAYELTFLAPDITSHLKAGGVLVLSGILKEQKRKILEAYGPGSFLLLQEKTDPEFEEWTALILKKIA